jgi:hypothetical protein
MASEHSLSIEPLLRLNEGQLRLLLANEPPAIQRRVSALLRSSALTQLPSSLRQALAEHLMQLWSASALPSKDLIKERGGWWETLRSRFS